VLVQASRVPHLVYIDLVFELMVQRVGDDKAYMRGIELYQPILQLLLIRDQAQYPLESRVLQ
jgi:hypothetical protein